jgi:DNA-binding MarR family transcriptional regulator
VTHREKTGTSRADAVRLLRGIRALVRRFALSERADVACCGMTVAQAATLEALRDGGLRIVDLGRRLGISPSTLSRNLDRLEERGLLARSADEQDARAFVISLTKAGRAAADEVAEGEVAFARAVLDQLAPATARRDTVESLERLLHAVRGATEECCPGAFDHLMKDFPGEPAPAEPPGDGRAPR